MKIIDVQVASLANPLHGHGIGDAILMLPVIAGIAAKNSDAHVRAVVLDAGREQWIKLGWPHTVTLKSKEPLHNVVFPQRWESLGGDKKAIDAGLTRQGMWAKEAGVEVTPVTPIIPQEARDWAEKISEKQFYKQRFVWISPWACGRERTWPERRWAELIDGLLCAGCTIAGIRQAGGTFFDGVTWFEDTAFPADRTAAMFEKAALVIGNDSGMAHLGGFLNVPTLAICGPTVGSCVFGNYKSVRVVQAGMHCNGCMGLTKWYNPRHCRIACDALNNLPANDVLKVALEMLDK